MGIRYSSVEERGVSTAKVRGSTPFIGIANSRSQRIESQTKSATTYLLPWNITCVGLSDVNGKSLFAGGKPVVNPRVRFPLPPLEYMGNEGVVLKSNSANSGDEAKPYIPKPTSIV